MKAITEGDCQIVRDLHDEGLSDGMIAHRFGWTTTHVRNIYNVPEGMF